MSKKSADIIDFPPRPDSGLGATPLNLGFRSPTSGGVLLKPLSTVKPPTLSTTPKPTVSNTASGITSTTPKPLPFHVGFTVKPPTTTPAASTPTVGVYHAPPPPGKGPAGSSQAPGVQNTQINTRSTRDPNVSHKTTFKRGDRDPVINGLQQHLIAWGFAHAK